MGLRATPCPHPVTLVPRRLSKAMRQGDGDVGFWHETYIVKEVT